MRELTPHLPLRAALSLGRGLEDSNSSPQHPTLSPWSGREDYIPHTDYPTLSLGERVAALCRRVRGLLLPARRGLAPQPRGCATREERT